MRFSTLIAAACGVVSVSAHGLVTNINGANGVTMNGLSAIARTPRDSPSPRSGAEADTSIIRQKELGTKKASALGRTEGGGPVDAAAAVSSFLGNSAAAAEKRSLKDLLAGRKGKGKAAAAGGAAGGASDAVGTKSSKGAVQEDDAGLGTSGLPTCSDSGVVSMTYHQVNQDGAGPLTAMVDPTSGGTDPAAFIAASMIADVPGKIAGLSATTTTDFAISAQMPAGMVCSGTVAGVKNVCVLRLNNNALAGPFGGSVVFQQSAKAAKRAVEYNLARRHFARGMVERAALPANIQDDEDEEDSE